MLELKSLDLQVWGSQAAGYTVAVTGPEGERASAPLDGALLAGLRADLDAILAGVMNRAALERVGQALLCALLPLEVRLVYTAVQARLGEEEGLRLRLHLPPELARLPWELLYDPPHYLSTDPRTPVVRFLDLPDAPRPLAVRPPLCLLHLVASPADAPPLRVDRERATLEELARQGLLKIVPGRPGTLAALRDGLREGCHLLHFSGHGGFSGGAGYLLFEDDAGRGQPADSDTLAHLLHGSSVRLALLNACESALADESNAFSSVAAALVQAGLPAVIAHQVAMPDTSAAAFAAELYRALADDYPVDAAMSEGRKAVLSELGPAWRERVDWATPVLFMQVPDGRLFVRAETAPSQPVPPPPADPLPNLLAELRQVLRSHVPQEKQAQAMERYFALSGAAGQKRPDLDVIESALRWFGAELPHLSGAVYNVLGGLQKKLAVDADDLLPDFRRRFGEFW